MDRLLREEAIFPDKKARSLLQALRRKRRFTSMGLLAEAFLQSGLRTSQVRRQYAQALIDQGMLKGAEEYLRRLLEDPETNDSEQAEAHGLLGRIYKQLYVNEYTKANPARAERNLQGAFDEYALSYREDPIGKIQRKTLGMELIWWPCSRARRETGLP
jgi:predicted Zn-dependent protease